MLQKRGKASKNISTSKKFLLNTDDEEPKTSFYNFKNDDNAVIVKKTIQNFN